MMGTTVQVPGRVQFGLFKADLSSGTLFKRGIPIHIQEKPFQILRILLQRPGELVTRDELRKQLWPADTFVAFDEGLNTAIGKLRNALNDSAERPAFVETVRGKGYRFIASVSNHVDGTAANDQPVATVEGEDVRRTSAGQESWLRRRLFASALAIMVIILTLAFSLRRNLHSTVLLTDKDTIVVVDFANSTGEPVFDDPLREALVTELQQSPFLSVVSDQTIRETLRLMHRGPTDRIAAAIGSDLCQRVGSKALVEGSITRLGREYVVGLNAMACGPGDSLARVKVQTATKEGVLKALDSAAAQLRRRLGESIASIQKFDTPIEQATTTSLEALRAYSIGRKILTTDDAAPAVSWFQQAIRLDPTFAMAYASLGTAYANINETSLSIEATKKAYELRHYAGEREAWYIESHYYQMALRDFERARQIYEVWQRMYPRDILPHHNLTDIYDASGQFERSLAQERDALGLNPSYGLSVGGLLLRLCNLNRLSEARAAAEAARKRKLESAIKGVPLYMLAFLSGDEAGMAAELSWAKDNPGDEDIMLSFQSDTEAFFGRLAQSRELSREAVRSALRAKENETAAMWQVNAALREIEFGDRFRARADANRALAIFPGVDVRILAAMTFARIGDAMRAEQLTLDLDRAHSQDTLLNSYWQPSIAAAIALRRRDASKALDLLRATSSYELGISTPSCHSATLYPVFLRGEAYLALHRPKEAAAEFQKFLDHRGAVKNFPLGALALLQLARAKTMSGDYPGAKNLYESFLMLWRNADPGLTVLTQAEAEYRRLN
jgi:DNA-binding winged helix-turn-helix (wHTH) protein/tetratricopeptide (TPR) repeat protein